MNTLLCGIPYHLDVVSFSKLCSVLDSANICTGNSQSHFVEMANSRKGMLSCQLQGLKPNHFLQLEQLVAIY